MTQESNDEIREKVIRKIYTDTAWKSVFNRNRVFNEDNEIIDLAIQETRKAVIGEIVGEIKRLINYRIRILTLDKDRTIDVDVRELLKALKEDILSSLEDSEGPEEG